MDVINVSELEHLYSTLTPAERDELLECVLINAAKGEKLVIQFLETHLLDLAGREFIDQL